MNKPILYRKRLIPEECVLLKDDEILLCRPDLLITKWVTLKPRLDFHHGYSCYFLKEGYKISRFYRKDGSLLYHYCDIIRPDYFADTNELIVTDLLADVIIYPNGFVQVVDIGELSEASQQGLIGIDDIRNALSSLQNLLDEIYGGRLDALMAPLDEVMETEAVISC